MMVRIDDRQVRVDRLFAPQRQPILIDLVDELLFGRLCRGLVVHCWPSPHGFRVGSTAWIAGTNPATAKSKNALTRGLSFLTFPWRGEVGAQSAPGGGDS